MGGVGVGGVGVGGVGVGGVGGVGGGVGGEGGEGGTGLSPPPKGGFGAALEWYLEEGQGVGFKVARGRGGGGATPS